MVWLNDILLFLHFVGLLMGSAPGIANMVIMRQMAQATPDGAAALRALPPNLAMISAVGVAVLWITGVILVFTKWSGFQNLPAMFWIKFLFVVILTVIIGMIQMTIREMRRTGNTALAARLPKLGPLAGLAALLTVFFAVVAFQ